MLKETPIAYTGLITFAGAGGEAAIIERAEDLAFVQRVPAPFPTTGSIPIGEGIPGASTAPGGSANAGHCCRGSAICSTTSAGSDTRC